MGGIFGGGTSTEYVQSPEQRQVYQTIMPLLQGLVNYGMYNMGMPYGAPTGGSSYNYGGTGGVSSVPYTPQVTQAVSAANPEWLNAYYSGTGIGHDNVGELRAYNQWVASMRAANKAQQQQGTATTNAPTTTTAEQTSAQKPTLGQPLAPVLPPMEGVLTGVPMYQIPGMATATPYNIPGIPTSTPYSIPNIPTATPYNIPGAVLPSSDWYSNLSPEVMQGVWAPYQEGAEQMLELLGGSTRGGYSGATGAALGKYYSDASKNVGMQAWQMTQPGLMAEWEAKTRAEEEAWLQNVGLERSQWEAMTEAEKASWMQNAGLQRSQWEAMTEAERMAWLENQSNQDQLWTAELQRSQADYSNRLLEQTRGYENEANRMMADYASAMQAWQMPYNALGLMGGTYSTPIVSQQPGLFDLASAAFPWAFLASL